MTTLIADIATGNTGWADLFFLLAVLLAVLAGVAAWARDRLASPLLSGAVAAVALAFLLL